MATVTQPEPVGIGRGGAKLICKKMRRIFNCSADEIRASLLAIDPIVFEGQCSFRDKWFDDFRWYRKRKLLLFATWAIVCSFCLLELLANASHLPTVVKDFAIICFASHIAKLLHVGMWRTTFFRLFDKLDYRKNHLEYTRIVLLLRGNMPVPWKNLLFFLPWFHGWIGLFGNDNSVEAWLEELKGWQNRLKSEGDNHVKPSIAEITQISQAVPEYTKDRLPRLVNFYQIPYRIGFMLPLVLVITPILYALLMLAIEIVS
jgi:hypothetical protein